MKHNLTLIAGFLFLASTWLGCSGPVASESPAETRRATVSVDGSKYLLNDEPSSALDVIKVRENSSDGDEVVVVGRIGGSENPWIEGRAAFSIVDKSLKACSDIPGDQCEKPWDYCCETSRLPTASALVKVIDADGALVEYDARDLLQVKELSTVVVTGKAQRDEAGNLVVLASGVFVKEN